MWVFFRSSYVSTLSTAMFSCILVFYSVLVQPCSMYVGILFSLSTLVRLVRPCSMHVCILFGLSTLVHLVRPCSMYVGIFFGLGTLVRSSTAMFSCTLLFFSVLVR